jgi:hypothetical protein
MDTTTTTTTEKTPWVNYLGSHGCLTKQGVVKCNLPTSNKRVYTNEFGTQLIVNPDNTQTQSQRIAALVRYGRGGATQFGNRINPGQLINQAYLQQKTASYNATSNNPLDAICSVKGGTSSFLGRVEGQPGGITGPLRLRNKF